MAAVGVVFRDTCGDLWRFKIRLEKLLVVSTYGDESKPVNTCGDEHPLTSHLAIGVFTKGSCC